MKGAQQAVAATAVVTKNKDVTSAPRTAETIQAKQITTRSFPNEEQKSKEEMQRPSIASSPASATAATTHATAAAPVLKSTEATRSFLTRRGDGKCPQQKPVKIPAAANSSKQPSFSRNIAAVVRKVESSDYMKHNQTDVAKKIMNGSADRLRRVCRQADGKQYDASLCEKSPGEGAKNREAFISPHSQGKENSSGSEAGKKMPATTLDIRNSQAVAKVASSCKPSQQTQKCVAPEGMAPRALEEARSSSTDGAAVRSPMQRVLVDEGIEQCDITTGNTKQSVSESAKSASKKTMKISSGEVHSNSLVRLIGKSTPRDARRSKNAFSDNDSPGKSPGKGEAQTSPVTRTHPVLKAKRRLTYNPKKVINGRATQHEVSEARDNIQPHENKLKSACFATKEDHVDNCVGEQPPGSPEIRASPLASCDQANINKEKKHVKTSDAGKVQEATQLPCIEESCESVVAKKEEEICEEEEPQKGINTEAGTKEDAVGPGLASKTPATPKSAPLATGPVTPNSAESSPGPSNSRLRNRVKHEDKESASRSGSHGTPNRKKNNKYNYSNRIFRNSINCCCEHVCDFCVP